MAEFVGTSTDRVVVIGELSRITADIGPDMLGHNINLATNVEKRSAICMLQREYHGIAIRCSDALDEGHYPILIKRGMRLHEAKGERDIRAGKRLTVTPFHPGANCECQLCQIAGVG